MRTKRTKRPTKREKSTAVRVRLSASRAREEFAETIDRVRYTGERVMLHKHGKDVVAIVPKEDLELLEALEDQADYRAAVERLKDPKARIVPLENLLKRFPLD